VVVSDPVSTSAVPWLVAEAVLLELTRLRPATVHLLRDAGRRIARHLEAADADDELWTLVEGVPPARCSCAVWIGDGATASVDARAEVLALAAATDHDVLLCEPIAPGTGVGLHLLRAIDPTLTEIVTDELGDGHERTRERKPWEPRAKWVVAHARAWRFESEAELARDGFIARLPRMTPAQILLSVRRILARYGRAHELMLLAIEELVRRGDQPGASMVWDELAQHGAAAGPVLMLARTCMRAAFADAMCERWERRATG
jgi:hypothetical protein